MWRREERQEWRSGPWSLELRDDEFADVSFEGQVVLRSVRAVIRDRDWATAGLVIDAVDSSESALTLHVRSDGLGADLNGIVRAEIRGPGLLRVHMDLAARRAFETNRTGLVVLHPPGLAGAGLEVRHTDGTVTATRFPEQISPHQPAVGIAGLAWSHDGLDVDLRFDGDVFEMEDQRNWTDASYKTYSRPLDLPFPYPLTAGEHVVQTIEVTVTGAPAPAKAGPTVIRLHEGTAFPAIGVSASTAPDPAPRYGRITQPSAVLVELDLSTGNWRAALRRAAASGRPLDVRFVLTDSGTGITIAEGAHALRGLPAIRVSAYWPTGPAAHVSDRRATVLLRAALSDAGVRAQIVGGARSHFTELNREHHRLPGDLNGVVFSVTPLFHSLGTEQLVESLAVQRLVAAQAVDIAHGLPVHVGPISLRPHFNNVATTPPPNAEHQDLRDGYGPALLTDAVDDRQRAPELAAWAVASAAALAVEGVQTLSFFEEWGPRGIRDALGEPLPVLSAIAALSALHGAPALRGDSPDHLIWAIGALRESGSVVLVANLDVVARHVEIVLPDGAVRAVSVDAGGFERL